MTDKLLTAEDIFAMDRGALVKLVAQLQVELAATGKKDAHNFPRTHAAIEDAKHIRASVDAEVERRERERIW